MHTYIPASPNPAVIWHAAWCQLVLQDGHPRPHPTMNAAQETLRKYSVVPVVTRMCAQDTTLDGIPIPAGCYIACLLQVSHSAPGCLQTCGRQRPCHRVCC